MADSGTVLAATLIKPGETTQEAFDRLTILADAESKSIAAKEEVKRRFALMTDKPYDIGFYIDLFISKINKVKTTKCTDDFIMLLTNIDNYFWQADTEIEKVSEELRQLFCQHFREPLKRGKPIPTFEELDDGIAKYMVDYIIRLCENYEVRALLDAIYKV